MLLGLIVFAIVAYMGVRWLKDMLPDQDPPPSASAPAPGPRLAPSTPIVACSHCGTHIPVGEALVLAGGRVACSEAHRRALDG